jgi:hypothetical protein
MPHRVLEGAEGVFARIISATSQSADADYKPETGLLASDDPFSGFPAIEDCGIIGDWRAAALLKSRGRSTDCAGQDLTSRQSFAALLDRVKGGYWKIVALSAGKTVSSEQIERHYVPETKPPGFMALNHGYQTPVSVFLPTRFSGPFWDRCITSGEPCLYEGSPGLPKTGLAKTPSHCSAL